MAKVSNPDWTKAPKDATHWDTVAGDWCNNRGARRPDGTYDKYFIRDWGTHRYIARPENNTELEEVSMTKVTVEHKGKAQPSIFYKGNIVTIWDGSVVLVTAGMGATGTFSGVKLCPYLGTASDNFGTDNCKQFHGTLTVGSL